MAGYTSVFGKWETRSGVRTRPPRVMDESAPTALFFPPEFVPAATNPLAVARGPQVVHDILVHSLYQYLHFTSVLEQVTVLPVTAAISVNSAGVHLPERMRTDAFKITTDEAWHAQISHDFTNEVVGVTGIRPDAVVEPAFVQRLRRDRDSVEPCYRKLADLVFAVVSETLVSFLLSDIPRDRRLPRPVRDLVADHAADEGRHHAYFRSLLRFLWPQLEPGQRRWVGPRVPELVTAFLRPDLESMRAVLRANGFNPSEVAQIMEESYGGLAIPDLARAARSTVLGFREVGALDDPATYQAFADATLLPRDPES